MRTVCVCTKDPRVSRVCLLLLRAPECERFSLFPVAAELPQSGAALTVADAGTPALPPPAITVGKGGTLPFPFRREDFFAAVEAALQGGAPDALPALTPREAALFALLSATPGVPVPRERLLALWKDGQSESGLGVYLYRLRRKLEADGRRRLFTVRGGGYLYAPAGKGAQDADADPR